MSTWAGSKVLIIRLSSLGDVARLLPSLGRLRRSCPGFRIDLAVEDRFAGLLDLFPLADRLQIYPRRAAGSALRHPVRWLRMTARYIRDLRREEYDLALDLHGILRSALLARLSGSRATAGYARGFGKECSHLLYALPLRPGEEPRISRYLRYEGALTALGIGGASAGYLEPSLPRQSVAMADGALRGMGAEPGGYLLAFIGTSRAQARKRWPVSHFVALAEKAWNRLGIPTLVAWGPEEADLLSGIPISPHIHILPETDLAGLVAFIRSARAFVGADTGAMHLAALMGIPTVAVLGPTDPVLNRPYGNRVRVVHDGRAVRACAGRKCSHEDCMALIDPQAVSDALASLLKGLPPESSP